MAIEVTGKNAASLGAMLTASVLTDLASAGEEQIKRKNGDARTLMELVAIYGNDVLMHFPKPGTKAKDHKSNVLTDIGPWGEDGKQVSWYSVYYSGSSQGKMLYEQLRKLTDAKSTYDNEAMFDRDKAAINQRINTAVTRVKNAVKLCLQLEAVNNETEVTAIIDMDGSEVVRSNKCIFMRNDNMSKFKQWTIGQFLRIDVNAAADMKGGATWDNVLATAKAEPKDPMAGYIVKNPKQFDTSVGVTLSYLVDVQQAGNEKEYKSLLAHLNEGGSDYLLLSMDAMYQKLENYLELPSIKTRLLKLHEDGGMPALEAIRRAQAAA